MNTLYTGEGGLKSHSRQRKPVTACYKLGNCKLSHVTGVGGKNSMCVIQISNQCYGVSVCAEIQSRVKTLRKRRGRASSKGNVGDQRFLRESDVR